MGKHFTKQHQKILNVHTFCSPEKAMLDNQGKFDFNTEYFLFSEKFEPSSMGKDLTFCSVILLSLFHTYIIYNIVIY